MITLTPELLSTLKGKKIRWYAPASKYNEDYTGIALITDVNISERRPIKSETIVGENLDFAFIDDMQNNEVISYSDSYRDVIFKIVE